METTVAKQKQKSPGSRIRTKSQKAIDTISNVDVSSPYDSYFDKKTLSKLEDIVRKGKADMSAETIKEKAKIFKQKHIASNQAEWDKDFKYNVRFAKQCLADAMDAKNTIFSIDYWDYAFISIRMLAKMGLYALDYAAVLRDCLTKISK